MSTDEIRRSRFAAPTFDVDIRGTPRAVETLRLFDNYRLLPFNWMHALVRGGSYVGYRNLCTRMVDAGLLSRFTFNGTRNINETMTYERTERGDRFLHERGFVGLPHDGTHDAHQVLTDLLDASIELGARGSDVELRKWPDILHHPKTPPLPEKPFRFDVGHTKLIPDGRPFYLKRGNRSVLFLKELDRNNEAPATIKFKLQNYQASVESIQRRFGFPAFMLLFVTTNATREENVLRWIHEVIGDCKWILTNVITDHIKETLTTAPVTTALFDEPYNRAGHAPYSLKLLGEVS